MEFPRLRIVTSVTCLQHTMRQAMQCSSDGLINVTCCKRKTRAIIFIRFFRLPGNSKAFRAHSIFYFCYVFGDFLAVQHKTTSHRKYRSEFAHWHAIDKRNPFSIEFIVYLLCAAIKKNLYCNKYTCVFFTFIRSSRK